MKNPHLYELARSLKSQGKSYQDVGEILGVSRQRVQQIVSLTEKERSLLIEKNHNKCSLCGIEKNNLEVHHLDYEKNIVIILCFNCHRFLHREIRKEEMEKRGIMELDVIIQVRETHENIAILKAFAKSHRMKLSDVVREALFDFMAKHDLLPLEETPNEKQALRN